MQHVLLHLDAPRSVGKRMTTVQLREALNKARKDAAAKAFRAASKAKLFKPDVMPTSPDAMPSSPEQWV